MFVCILEPAGSRLKNTSQVYTGRAGGERLISRSRRTVYSISCASPPLGLRRRAIASKEGGTNYYVAAVLESTRLRSSAIFKSFCGSPFVTSVLLNHTHNTRAGTTVTVQQAAQQIIGADNRRNCISIEKRPFAICYWCVYAVSSTLPA